MVEEQVFVITFLATWEQASDLAATLDDDGHLPLAHFAAFASRLATLGDGRLAIMSGDEFCNRSGGIGQDIGLAQGVDF